LITRLKHEETLSSLQTLFPPLIALLTSTRLTPLPSYTITTPPPTSPTKEPEGSFSTAEKTVSSLTERLEILTTFTITPSTTLTISSQTSTFYSTIYTKHHITLSPSSPLNETCKPPPPPLNDFSAVREYVGFAMGCALAANFATEPELHDQEVEERAEGWHITSQPHVLRKTLGSPEGGPEGRSKQLSFLVLDSSSGKSTGNPKTGLILKLVWDWMRDTSLSGNGNGNKEKERLREKGEGSYEWNEKSFAEWEDGEGEIVRSLDDVVEAAGKF
jgi:hypothetical protein